MKKLIILIAFVLVAGVAYGQTVQKGTVIGVYDLEITLDPDVTMNQFLTFMTEKSIPAWNKHCPGVKFFILKGYRGDNVKGYGLSIVCDSKEVFDKYWDKEGQPTDLMKGLMENELKDVQEESMKLGWMNWDFTDYVVL